MKVGDLIRINDEGALNIDEKGIHTGSVGIVIKVEPDDPRDKRQMGDLHTVIIIANNRRIPYLFDCEIEKFE